MPSGTNLQIKRRNLQIKRRKLERLVRRAFRGEDAIKYVQLAQSYRGGASSIFVSNALIRDILNTLEELDELA